MSGAPEQSREWITCEDAACREERIARLDWLASIYPPAEYISFPGGLMSKYLFDEMRYCFAYGQYLAAIVLGLAYIERTLGSEFYAVGRADLERAGIAKLLSEARNVGMLTNDEVSRLEEIRRSRNPVAHFRPPGHKESIESRSVMQDARPYELLEGDARSVIQAAMNILSKRTA